VTIRPVKSGNNQQGTLPEQELALLLAEMNRGMPWRDALERLNLPILSAKRNWLTDLGKARYYGDLPVGSHRRAVDIGAGSGVIAQGLTERFEEVVALEQHPGWCAFMRSRYAQDNVNRVAVVQGGAMPTLPFPDAHFDLAVVNGVLEWIPESAPTLNPGKAQEAFLRDVRRVLSPGGTIGIAIENRLFLRNFLGTSPHGEPSMAVVMPRLLADWYTRGTRGTPYRTWIYSYWGYRRLLRRAGFTDVLVQPVLPTYHQPERVIDVGDTDAARRAFGAPGGFRGAMLHVLNAAGLLGYLTHSFYIRARVDGSLPHP
jgi:SAM-dependent methyltransferase